MHSGNENIVQTILKWPLDSSDLMETGENGRLEQFSLKKKEDEFLWLKVFEMQEFADCEFSWYFIDISPRYFCRLENRIYQKKPHLISDLFSFLKLFHAMLPKSDQNTFRSI